MNLKIATVGSNHLIAEEVLNATKFIIGNDINIKAYSTHEVQSDNNADLYICALTQLNALMKIVPVEKIVILELIPTAKFFISVSRVPRAEEIYIFNNKLEYTRILGDHCKQLGIHGVNFLPIAYNEMPVEEVCNKLQQAKFIIGVDKFVGEAVLLSEKYRHYLRTDVTIIPATRVASIRSACALLQWLATYFHQNIAQRVAAITSKLNNTDKNPNQYEYEKEVDSISQELEKLTEESSKSIDLIQAAAIKSVINHISPDITMSVNKAPQVTNCNVTRPSSPVNIPIFEALESITSLSDTLLYLAQSLGKID